MNHGRGAILLALGLPMVAAGVAPSEDVHGVRRVNTWHLGNWVMWEWRLADQWSPFRFELARKGAGLQFETGWLDVYDLEMVPLPPDGSLIADLNGDGVAEVWIRSSISGGAHPGGDAWILSLGDDGVVEVVPSPFLHIILAPVDVDGDGVYELVGKDTAFDSWYTVYWGGEGMPDVVLRWEGGVYRIAPDLQPLPGWEDSPAPPDEGWWRDDPSKYFQEFAPWGKDGPVPGSLWMNMVALIHMGRAQDAWVYFDDNWPAWKGGKGAFLEEFLDNFARSTFCWGLLRINGMALDEEVAKNTKGGDIRRRPQDSPGWQDADPGCREGFAALAARVENEPADD